MLHILLCYVCIVRLSLELFENNIYSFVTGYSVLPSFRAVPVSGQWKFDFIFFRRDKKRRQTKYTDKNL
jgi:hypothetical protein